MVIQGNDVLGEEIGNGWDLGGGGFFLCGDFGKGAVFGDEICIGFLGGGLGFEAGEFLLLTLPVKGGDIENDVK